MLVVDNTYADNLAAELSLLQQDLIGDGWMVVRQDVSRDDTPPVVKALIKAQYDSDPNNVKAVFLFGHVPVPYSGDIAPDEHVDHRGAWPADAYYGDMTGIWTDYRVNNSRASDPRNHNVPGDGKFDQSVLPAVVDLMVGRVDLANLPGKTAWNSPPTFPGELELLRNYLNKDHNFRHKLITLPRRGLVGDYFGIYNGYAFAASGWRNFAPFFGADNVISLPDQGTWIPTLANNGYLCAYGCGLGNWASVNGIGSQTTYHAGTTTDLVEADPQAAFMFLFGSWLGDWDVEDDLMRSVLATPTYGLVCAWSGSPHWFCHHMGLGETIGYSTRLTQNNGPGGLYQNQINSYAGLVHVALMGDPTLFLHPVTPPSALTGTLDSGNVNLSWSASGDAVLGYHVYRSLAPSGPFSRLTSSLTPATSFTDPGVHPNNYVYMVRAVQLELSASGTYFNPSQGIFLPMNVTSSATPLTLQIRQGALGPQISWNSQLGTVYQVLAAERPNQTQWTNLSGDILATGPTTSWTDINLNSAQQRFYRVSSP